jgi:hypothetical protein
MAIDPKLTYQVSPIFLTGGAVGGLPGSVCPLIWFTQRDGDPTANYSVNVMGMGISPTTIAGPVNITAAANLDQAFATFNVVPGGALIAQTLAKYPFANQFTASNATIREPLSLSVIMDTPMRGKNAWSNKLAIMTSLKLTLDAHNNLGGRYHIMTPSFLYTDMIMTAMADASRALGPTNVVPQNAWQFTFEKPLITLEELQAAISQNLMMAKITSGVPTSPQLTDIRLGSIAAQPQLQIPALVQPGLDGLLAAGNTVATGVGQVVGSAWSAISTPFNTPQSPGPATYNESYTTSGSF